MSSSARRGSTQVHEKIATLNNQFFGKSGLERAEGAKFSDVLDPSTAGVLGEISDLTEAQVDRVVADANIAQKQWNTLSALERAEHIHEAARKVRENQRLVAEILSHETGKPFKESFDEVSWAITAMDYYAEIGRHSIGTVHGTATAGQFHYTLKEPMGTAVIILPANYPVVLAMWTGAAALAAGNAIIIKPSEWATLTTLAFAEAFDVLPAGLVQVVPGTAPTSVQLVNHKDTHQISFTGSVPTGKIVAKSCGEQFKPCIIEASGSDPFIVMPSAKLDVAARGAAFAAFINCGQVCTSTEKLIVHNDIYDEFMRLFTGHVAALRQGHPLDKVDVGPMENGRELTRLESVIARAVEQGATVTIGGGRPTLGDNELATGFFHEPTVLENVTRDMDIYQQEIFGPAVAVYRVSSFDEALDLANGSPFGLGSNLYSTDVVEIDRAVNEIVAGMVWVNAPLLDNDAGPFGGRKMSGIGRQLGAEGLETFRHTKFMMVDAHSSEQNFWWFPYSDEEAYK